MEVNLKLYEWAWTYTKSNMHKIYLSIYQSDLIYVLTDLISLELVFVFFILLLISICIDNFEFIIYLLLLFYRVRCNNQSCLRMYTSSFKLPFILNFTNESFLFF